MSVRPPLEDVAGVAHRLAVLLAAGVPPPAAWRHLAAMQHAPAVGAVVRTASEAAARGEDVAAALAEAACGGDRDGVPARVPDRRPDRAATVQAWGALAAVWTVAIEVGAPLAASLRDVAASFRDVGRLQREARVAFAGPRATARMVAFLPAVAVLFGALLGLETVRMLVATPIGWACLVVGGALMLLGNRWSGSLLRNASRAEAVPGLVLDLTAVALAGGASLARARSVAEAAAQAYAPTAAGDAGADRIDGVLALARAAGVPAAELLRAEAEEVRLAARTAGQERAARLGVSLMLPLGVCVLPAFMLLGVAPMIMAVISSTAAGF